MHAITEQYKNEQKKFQEFTSLMENLIRELLIQKKIKFHKIESRHKDVDRLEEKINRKDNKYNDILEITDIVALRVITYFEDEVDKVAQIIETEFIKDILNSIDKRKVETDKFGYKSLHYVVSLDDKRIKLTEYHRFKDIKFEIQMRSILQHAWAEIEHDIGYKGELEPPAEFRRNFSRIAALLEIGDIEFVNLKNRLIEYKKKLPKEIKDKPEDVEINSASLKSYAMASEKVKEIDEAIIMATKASLDHTKTNTGSYPKLLNFLQIKSIKEVDKLMIENQDKIVKFAEKWIDKPTKIQFMRGISIFYLCYVLVGNKDLEQIKKYMEVMGLIPAGNDLENRALRVMETYKEINK